MVEVAIEYMIMIPVLIALIFLLPFAAGAIMDKWTSQRQAIALQQTASHLGSSIQQTYFSLNDGTFSSGTFKNTLQVPPLIETYAYSGNATLRSTSDPTLNQTQFLYITLTFIRGHASATASVALGPLAQWKNSTFTSTSTTASIIGQKFSNGTIQLYFGS